MAAAHCGLARAPSALRDGRLIRLLPIALSKDQAYALWFAYPTGLREWPPLGALREWLFDELQRSERWLRSQGEGGTAPKAGRARRR